MAQVDLVAWRPGLNKVQLTKTLQAELALPLPDATAVTDRVLGGEPVSLVARHEDAAARLVGLLTAISCDCRIRPAK